VRALPILLFLVACSPAAASDPPALEASQPHDPDLDVGTPCEGGPSIDALTGALPTYVKELVVLWPRAGCTTDKRSAARFTLVNHQGEILTLTVIVRPKTETSAPKDYRVLRDDGIPRAELEAAPSADHPNILVRVAGQAATPREALEGAGDFIDLPALVAAFGALL
jgi:hypothetical protein